MNSSGVSLIGLQNATMQASQQQSEDQRQEMPRPYKCPMCDKAFHRLEHQTRHIRTHTGEKPHHCQFPGCTKKFSRSDELTRHSRIHNNPNSRRGRGQMLSHGRHQLPDAVRHVLLDNQLMPPPKTISRSAPSSHIGSPNVSPPNQYYAPYLPVCQSSGHYGLRSGYNSGTHTPNGFSRTEHNVELLATAASRVERDQSRAQPLVNFATPPHQTGAPRMGDLSQYHMKGQPMSRSHSHENDDPYLHRPTKKSRPNSPYSTAPPSPTFSHDSQSPTPDHTPIETPGPSPRIRALGWTDVQLPSLRALTLHHSYAPALAPMEPVAESTANIIRQTSVSGVSGPRISDILDRSDGAQRKLPVPRLAVSDLLNGPPVVGDRIMHAG